MSTTAKEYEASRLESEAKRMEKSAKVEARRIENIGKKEARKIEQAAKEAKAAISREAKSAKKSMLGGRRRRNSRKTAKRSRNSVSRIGSAVGQLYNKLRCTMKKGIFKK